MIQHNKPTLGIEEQRAALRVLESSWIAQGKEVEFFENEICNFLGLPQGHAVAVSSGTSALYLALWSLTAKDKTVGIPSYVCSALRNAVAMAGGKEIVVDTEKESPNIDINLLNIENPDIAIIPHMFGIPVDISKINPEIKIIEDCAQSLGAKIDGISTGLKGEIGILSFYATKLITSGGQGGMVISKNRNLIDKIKDYREFDCRHDDKLRFNFQMTDLQAAIGREQLKKLPSFLEKREEIFQKYKQKGLNLIDINKDKVLPVRYRCILKTNKPEKIIKKLYNSDIKAIIPVEDWELLSPTPNALELSTHTISLPIYPCLSYNELELVLSQLLIEE